MSLYHDFLRETHVSPRQVVDRKCRASEQIPLPPWQQHSEDLGAFATYLRHGLRHVEKGGDRHGNDPKISDQQVHELATKDIIAAAMKIAMLELDAALVEEEEENRAHHGDQVVEFYYDDLVWYFGARGLRVLQIMVAVAFKHHDHDLVVDSIAVSSPPARNLFSLKPKREGSCNTWF
ncbi:hypothetical protein F5Y15DRAFT_414930 [Xylariaceae sp. FL0016]|nr:hypothetical protein F5Y15DRAFT_414930 [Xylariaceae sp. FL0016]